ncbi:MAG: RnfABCDGE type electron transport complex subunit D [Eubacteriales bacterium]|nr:RnfABCDGE type electron transport complex subunit D [Eubacteriales bacterium]MDY3332292.1 RnfABCDGE type electron transport complex subunit D [Gallibacter sp.]
MEQKYYNNLIVSSSPHAVNNEDTRRIMLTVIAALIPSLCVSTYVFGFRVITLTLVCVVASVLFEYVWNLLMKKPQTATDGSAALTGLLIAFNVPSNLPFYIAIIGCAVGIIVVKNLFGGLGCNLFNPAITARIVLFISFATEMTTWPLPKTMTGTDALVGPTPLGLLKESSDAVLPATKDMAFGFIGGSMGEVSAIALLIGGLFLIFTKVITPHIPVAFIGTVAVISLLAGQDPIFHICAGGVMLGAFFMATDYVTSPLLGSGKIVFGIGCGVMTMLIRLFGNYPEGVSFAILLMNVLNPHIDNICEHFLTKPKKVKGGANDGK